MLPARTVNHHSTFILTSTSFSYKKDYFDITTKTNPKIEQYPNLEELLMRLNGQSNQSQRITKRTEKV